MNPAILVLVMIVSLAGKEFKVGIVAKLFKLECANLMQMEISDKV